MRVCCKCGKPFEPNRDKSYRCISCKSEYNKQHYERNKVTYIARATARKERVTAELNQLLWEYLLNHPCVDCGEMDPVVLEFDHIADKKAAVAQLVASGYSWCAILQEIAKCEVRCANCHRRITAKRGSWIRYRLNE